MIGGFGILSVPLFHATRPLFAAPDLPHSPPAL